MLGKLNMYFINLLRFVSNRGEFVNI